MAGSVHTYNLDLTLVQNHNTVVLSTTINGHNHFHFRQGGSYAP